MKIKCFLLIVIMSALQVSKAQHNENQKNEFKGVIGKTLAESKEVRPENIKAPEGAPNIVWILLDDVGFGATSTFGGLINTPVFDELADNGLRYNNFHTSAMCAPTRSALLTGRNSSAVHVAGFSHEVLSAGFPGWDGRIPSSTGTIAEILREIGYNTFGVGKYGLTPDKDATDAGPFDRWPTGKGFEQFFGFLGSMTDQYKPDLIENNAHIEPDGRHLSDQITDKAISYIEKQQKAAPGKPFFLYYSPAAVHSPHQVDAYWSDLYKGKFDEGWDVYREKVFAQQKESGIIPQDAKLPPRNEHIPAWETLSNEQKKLYARFMEVYAGYLTYTDYTVGKLINYLKEKKLYDNTAIFLLIGDNGASKEGTLHGIVTQGPRFNDESKKNQAHIDLNLENFDKIGTAEGTTTNFPLGWAQATNTPFKEWKQDANSEGGTRNPLVIHFPKLIKEKGGIRNQYSYVTDILPTTLEIIGVEPPKKIRGIEQDEIQGSSLYDSFNDPSSPTRHKVQHYYIFGSRAIYKDGWKASAAHHPNWLDNELVATGKQQPIEPDFDKDVWKLYHLDEDFNELNDLAGKNPKKLEELKKLFDEEAKKNNLYPLINWFDINKRRNMPELIDVTPEYLKIKKKRGTPDNTSTNDKK